MMEFIRIAPLALALCVLCGRARGDESCGGILQRDTRTCARSMVLRIPSDGSGEYHLVLNLTMPIFSNENINVELENKAAVMAGTTWELIYVVSHPTCDQRGRVTSLVFNNRVLCSNTPHGVKPEQSVTRLFFESTHFGNKPRVPPPQAGQAISETGPAFPNPFFVSPSSPSPVANRIEENNPDDVAAFTSNPFLSGARPTPAIHLPAQPSPPIEVDVNAICGISTYALVQGGTEVQPGEFPWLGGLFAVDGRKYLCTVNLVSQRHAITAAHCFAPSAGADAYGVLWGHPKSSPGRAYTRLRSVQIHPAYNRSTLHDVAVITLDDLLSFTLSLKPICLWRAGQAGGVGAAVRGMVAGFGPDYTDLKKVEYPIVSLETCRASNVFFHFATSEFTFCAGTRMKEVGPCKGDSGAGYMQWMDDRYYLRGLVSHSLNANGNCNLNEYIIFADLSKEMTWVRNVIR